MPDALTRGSIKDREKRGVKKIADQRRGGNSLG
jgi:hypothetical protein